MAERAALNLSYQDRMPTTGEPERLLTVKGNDLLGLPVKVKRGFVHVHGGVHGVTPSQSNTMNMSSSMGKCIACGVGQPYMAA